ncbi:GWxTD domain-containing protein [candidate division WOR-3 bacterium]|nr:GWxTD domain-containing protein [candidate division WOR-3 bacterium]
MSYKNRLDKKILLIIFFLLSYICCLFAKQGLFFKSDYTIFVDDIKKPNIYITVYIPYNQLNFTIADTLYKASVDVSAILYSGGDQKGGDIWRKTIVLDDFEKTNSNKEGVIWIFKIATSAGKFDLHINVKDAKTAQEGKRVEKIEVKDIANESFWVSKPAFLLGMGGVEKGMLISWDLNVEFDSIYTLVEFVIDTAQCEEYLLTYRATDEEGNIDLKINRNIKMESNIRWELISFPIKELDEGRYSVRIEVTKDALIVASSQKIINVNYPFFLSKMYTIRVEQMVYITNDKEMKKLKESKIEDRKKVWNEFWSKKDPIPETPENETSNEYFKRVDYANEHFRSYQSGWRSDRGRIYIIYGQPDDIEYHPFDLGSPPYQIWYYFNLGRKFIFADLSLTGDYIQVRE